MEESTLPDYTIPMGSADGVWDMMKKLVRFRGEGWLALWKGPYPGHATHLNCDAETLAIATREIRSTYRMRD
jgi:hypothetical protein